MVDHTKKRPKHTVIGIDLIKALSEEGNRIFTVADARNKATTCGISKSYLVEALHHLVNTGWIVRLKKGLYSISSLFPGMVPIHEFEIGMYLANPVTISHWSALHYHGMTEQMPRKVYLTTTQKIISHIHDKKQKAASIKVNGVFYEFIQVKPARFFGINDYWLGEIKIKVTDPERTLVDGLSFPRYFGDWPEVFNAFEKYLSKIDLGKIIDYAKKIDTATCKRLGWTLEKLGVENTKLNVLKNIPISGYRILDPSGSKKGKCNKKWMIQENLSEKLKI